MDVRNKIHGFLRKSPPYPQPLLTFLSNVSKKFPACMTFAKYPKQAGELAQTARYAFGVALAYSHKLSFRETKLPACLIGIS